MVQLSSNLFRERALAELLEIRSEVLDLATDKDIYWKVQKDIIQRNVRLLTIRNPFFDMLNDAYAHATAMRIRRLVDKDNRTISLYRLLQELKGYPDLTGNELKQGELEQDIDALRNATAKVKDYVDQFVAHHDRTPTSSAPIYRELNAAIDLLIQLFKKYYGILQGADIEVVVSYLEDPMSIFRFPWLQVDPQGAVEPQKSI